MRLLAKLGMSSIGLHASGQQRFRFHLEPSQCFESAHCVATLLARGGALPYTSVCGVHALMPVRASGCSCMHTRSSLETIWRGR